MKNKVQTVGLLTIQKFLGDAYNPDDIKNLTILLKYGLIAGQHTLLF